VRLLFSFEIAILPRFYEFRPRERAKNIHRRRLPDVIIRLGLLAEVIIGPFSTRKSDRIGRFSERGEAFVGEISSRTFLQFGRHIHRQKVGFEMIFARPRENRDLRQRESVLPHHLHDRIMITFQGVWHQKIDRLETDTRKTHQILFFNHKIEKTAPIGERAATFEWQINRCVRHGHELAAHVGQHEAAKLDELRRLGLIDLGAHRNCGEKERYAKKGFFHEPNFFQKYDA
jgi:hypothetical protein